MAWQPISNTVPQYQASDGSLANGYYLKFYASGTTTPISMATDTTGGTTLAKCQLNSSGYPINGSSAVFIPHIDQTYKLALYQNSTDADANTFANADWVVDAIPYVSAVLVDRTGTLTNSVSTTLDSWIDAQAISLRAEYSVNSSQTAAYNAAAIQDALNDAPQYSILILDDFVSINTSLDITNKTNLSIGGSGGIQLSSAASGDRIFNLVGTITRLKIKDLYLVGENNAAYFQAAIGNDSGQTINDVWFENLKIKQINVGISLNANSSGTYKNANVIGNFLTDIVGTASGQGYGIHLAKCFDAVVHGNIIDNASRHGCYQASGQNVNNVWSNNIIKNHRSAVASASLVAAFNLARSSGVTLIGNKFIDYSDGGLYIAHDTSTTENCHNIKVIGNEFRGRQNAITSITVGEQAVPGTYTTKHVTLEDNDIYSDEATCGTGGVDIYVNNGNNVGIKGNRLRRAGITTTTTFITVGNNTYVTTDDDCEDTIVANNEFIAEGSTLTATRAVTFASDISTNTSRQVVRDNEYLGISHPVYHSSIPTNPNIDFRGAPRPFILNGVAPGVAAATTAGYAKIVNAVRIANAGTVSNRTAVDDFWDLTAVTTGVGEYKKVLLCVDGAGTQARIVQGEVAASQAAALVPKVPDWDWVPMGVVELSPSYAGGALSTLYDVVGIYE